MSEILHSKPWITTGDLAAVESVLRSGMIGKGERVHEFELKMSQWLGATLPGVAVGSGTSALFLALKAVGCNPGSEVVLPTYVCHNVLKAVVATGAKPVLCDIGPDWVVQPANIQPHLTYQTKAVVVPHLYGILADIEGFRSFGIPIIEDCAQAIRRSTQKGIAGDIATYSFHPTKCLTCGEGGMAIARNTEWGTRLLDLRDSLSQKDGSIVVSPLSDLAAALGLSQLSRYETMLDRRQAIANRYVEALIKPLPHAMEHLLRLATMFYRFPLHCRGGLDHYQGNFHRMGIHIRRGVDTLLHRSMGLPDQQFPQALKHYKSTISLPLYPALTDLEVDRIVTSLKDLFGHSSSVDMHHDIHSNDQDKTYDLSPTSI